MKKEKKVWVVFFSDEEFYTRECLEVGGMDGGMDGGEKRVIRVGEHLIVVDDTDVFENQIDALKMIIAKQHGINRTLLSKEMIKILIGFYDGKKG